MLEKNMANAGLSSNDDYFYPGSIVKCTTCHDDEVQGEVMAFDHDLKMLFLKQKSSCGKPELNNVVLLNLEYIKSASVIKECPDASSPPSALSALNAAKILERYKEEVDLKMTLAKARSAGVSNDGIKLFNFLRKTLSDCHWSDRSIVIMDAVVVTPPYQLENCSVKDAKLSSSNQCLTHVKNIVERFHKEDRVKTMSSGT